MEPPKNKLETTAAEKENDLHYCNDTLMTDSGKEAWKRLASKRMVNVMVEPMIYSKTYGYRTVHLVSLRERFQLWTPGTILSLRR